MRCQTCNVVLRYATTTMLRGQRTVFNVPCRRCDSCGEEWFHAKVLKNIEALFQRYPDADVIPYEG